MEDFKIIKSCNLYEINKYGEVRNSKTNKQIKPYIDKCGYVKIGLRNNGKKKQYYVHRLVAETFIPNPNQYPCVNHIDENKQNNSIDNLEWCTYIYNLNYGTRNQRSAEKHKGKKASDETKLKLSQIDKAYCSKQVGQFNKDMVLLKTFSSIGEIVKELGLRGSNISDCCHNGRHKTVGGYIWKFL